MGTYCEVQVYDSDAARAGKAMAAALDEMQRVDRLLSNYAADSELSAMNREASRSPARTSPELYAFVRKCREFHDETLGTFDPTVGPLVRVWGFLSPRPEKPSEADIAAARSKSGFDKVLLNDMDRTVFYAVAGLEIDPGGIGKGYAVDKAVAVLKRLKVGAALVSAGGSTLYAVGHPPGLDAWRIAVRNSADPEKPYAIVRLRDNAVSTSGISEKSVKAGGRRYGHIFDPRTGEPVEGVCQVSVVAATATESDALTKAVFILSRNAVTPLLQKRTATHALRIDGACDALTAPWITPWSSAVFIRGDPPGTARAGDGSPLARIIHGAVIHGPLAHPVTHENGLRFVGPGFSPDAWLQPPAAPPEHRANQCAGPILGPIVPECLSVRAEARTHWSVGE